MGNILMETLWHDFIMICAKDKDILEAYRQERGHTLFPENPLEWAIDEATGALNDRMFDFARWVTEREWGMEYAPPAFIEECRRRDDAATKAVL